MVLWTAKEIDLCGGEQCGENAGHWAKQGWPWTNISRHNHINTIAHRKRVILLLFWLEMASQNARTYSVNYHTPHHNSMHIQYTVMHPEVGIWHISLERIKMMKWIASMTNTIRMDDTWEIHHSCCWVKPSTRLKLVFIIGWNITNTISVKIMHSKPS